MGKEDVGPVPSWSPTTTHSKTGSCILNEHEHQVKGFSNNTLSHQIVKGFSNNTLSHKKDRVSS